MARTETSDLKNCPLHGYEKKIERKVILEFIIQPGDIPFRPARWTTSVSS